MPPRSLMLLLALFACSPSPLAESDVDAVPWSGEFAWDQPAEAAYGGSSVAPEIGLVDFTLESDGADGFTGEFHYADAESESVYSLVGVLSDGVLILSQTAVTEDIDLPEDQVWCSGDYVLEMDGDALVGSYFPRTPDCLAYTGTARFEVD